MPFKDLCRCKGTPYEMLQLFLVVWMGGLPHLEKNYTVLISKVPLLYKKNQQQQIWTS